MKPMLLIPFSFPHFGTRTVAYTDHSLHYHSSTYFKTMMFKFSSYQPPRKQGSLSCAFLNLLQHTAHSLPCIVGVLFVAEMETILIFLTILGQQSKLPSSPSFSLLLLPLPHLYIKHRLLPYGAFLITLSWERKRHVITDY